jgi:hypothetical protein
MKILVFTEGTVLKHSSDDKFKDYASYIPAGEAVKKLETWVENGAEISYLTSRVKFAEIKQIKDVLKKFNFPEGAVHARQEGETYKAVVEALKPDVFVEDDCQSIGAEEMATPKLNSELGIKGIVVPEFGGIGHLPDNPEELKILGEKEAAGAVKDDTY